MFMLIREEGGGGGGGGGGGAGRVPSSEKTAKQVQARIKKNMEKQRKLANEQGGGAGAGAEVNEPSRPVRRQKKPKQTEQEEIQSGESLEDSHRIEEMMAGTRGKEDQQQALQKAEEKEQIDLMPIVDAVFGQDRELSPEEIEELHEAFMEFAKGKDGGYIKQTDLGECMRTMGYMPTEMELIELAQILGSKIDFEDWVELMGPKVVAETASMIGVKELRDAFKEFDSNSDGKINLAELREATKKLLGEQLPNTQIEEIVRDVDLNGDGLVDFEEFVRMMSR